MTATPKATKNKGGRPSKKKSISLKKVEKCAEKGLTNEQLAAALDVSKSTIDKYISEWAEFSSAIKRGKDAADGKVVRSLFQRACGYSCPEDKILSYEGKYTETVETVKNYPPDTTAAIFWLKNRRPKEWRDKHDVEHSGKIDRDHHIKDASEKDLDGILRSIITNINGKPKKTTGRSSGGKG